MRYKNFRVTIRAYEAYKSLQDLLKEKIKGCTSVSKLLLYLLQKEGVKNE